MTYLTQSNAPTYVGHCIDSSRPRFHHYPLRVFRGRDGVYYVADRNGTSYPVPDARDRGNAIPFDLVDGEVNCYD